MKWIILIAVLVVLAGVLYLRSVRTGDRVSDSRGPHRLDDSVSMSDISAVRAEPSPHTHTPPPTTAAEPPGSDFAHEPEISDPSTNGPSGPGGKPTA